ncbi:LPS assembly lipoprotein LptE [Brucella sp. NBRC 12950]|uniref:LPS assembly lipoprotein LptE n=1 Tax=Brucella sp. NBRC 12950 TaxID=2994518 RepID=UPI00255365DF|nr:LPS assembly lipoprotein LptE [Brucella sp. NBRC 12950]
MSNHIPNPGPGRFLRSLSCCMALFLSACVVKPLYAVDSGAGKTIGRAARPDLSTKLAAIKIDEVSDIFAVQVRNRLIFLLGRGAGEARSAAYRLQLNLKTSELASVAQNIGDKTDKIGRASLGIANATSNFEVFDKDGKILFAHSRSVSASFDRHRQEFATVSAQRNAMLRAADELAEQIYLDLAQTLGNQTG